MRSLPLPLPLLLPLLSLPLTSAATTCNGQESYCNRSYSSLTFVGSHDSAFVGPLPQQNQNLAVTAQLDLGIRYLQAQTHKSEFDDSIIELCHTSCLLEDAGSLESYLSTVKGWLDGHPDEVLTILLTNGDSLPVEKFGAVFEQTGLAADVFVPASGSGTLGIDQWPTLGEMIASGKRVVVFLDYGANTTSTPFILPEFDYYFETPFDVTDSSFSDCSINRPSGASATGRMYIINHFLDVKIFGILIPDRERASTTNAADGTGSIGAQSALCKGLYGRVPNVVLLDFVDKGQAMSAQNTLNGV